MFASTAPLTAPSAATGRDLRFDLLRGLCVACMIVGHLGWRKLTPHFNVGWATAADGFFLLSGATLGTVARRWRGSDRFAALLRRLPLRALWLYALNLLLVVVAYQWAVAGPFSPRAAARRFDGLPHWLGLLGFDHPLGLDVLPRYTVFLLASPFVLLALGRRRGGLAVGALSIGLWLAFHLTHGSLTVPVVEGVRPVFPLATWQLLFFGGVLLAHCGPAGAPRLGAMARRALLVGALVGTAAFVAAKLVTPGSATLPPEELRSWLGQEFLGPLRLLNLFVVALLAWRLVSRYEPQLVRSLGLVLLPLGQNALPAFLLHLPLLWVGNGVRLPAELEWSRLVAAGVAMVTISLLVRWRRLRKILAPV